MNIKRPAWNETFITTLLGLPLIFGSMLPFAFAKTTDEGVGGADQLDIPIEKQDRQANIKYRMARMAIEEGDLKLAQRFLHEALAAHPENSTLRFEYARFLAENGKGRQALEVVALFQGNLELTAKVEYLKEKLKVAEKLDGPYLETEKHQTDSGQPSKKMRADGFLHIDLGQIHWGQKINGKIVSQYYSFAVHKLRSGATSYTLKLKWESINDMGISYRPDSKDPELLAKKTKYGWALNLKVADENGGNGYIVFSAQNSSIRLKERQAK